MTGTHLIEELCFETDFASEEEAFEVQERLMRFMQGRAQQVIGEVFDEADDTDAILRLERLEVDVGTVAAADFEERFAERLREVLRTLLRERRDLVAETSSMGSSDEAGELGRFYTGLAQSGGMRGSAASSARPESLVGLGRSEGTGLSAARRKSAGPHARLDSSVGLGEPVSSLDALTTSARAELEWLLHFIEHGFLPWHAPAHIGRDVQALAARVLERTGAELARALQAVPAPRWRAIFRRLVAQFPAPWLGELGREIRRTSRKANRTTDAAESVTDTDELTDAEARTRARRARIEALLTEALESGVARLASAVVPVDTWRGILRDDADWLKATLLRFGGPMRVRRRLAEVLPEEVVAGVLGLWLRPAQVDLVLATMGARTGPIWGERENTDVLGGATSARGLLAALTYILVEGGASEFSELSYRRILETQAARDREEALEHEALVTRQTPDSPAGTDGDRKPTTVAGAKSAHNVSAPDAVSATIAVSTTSAVSTTGIVAVTAATAVIHTALPELHEALDGPDETLARSRARAQIESILNEPLESDPPLATLVTVTADTWLRVLRNDAQWLKETLLRLGCRIRARRRLATALPEEVVAPVLGLWLEPTQVDIVLASIDVSPSPSTGEPGSANTPHEASRTTWLLATLTYILVDGGAFEFSEGSYRHSLASQTARSRDEARGRERVADRTTTQSRIAADRDTKPTTVTGLSPANAVSAADVGYVFAAANPTDPRSPLCDAAPSDDLHEPLARSQWRAQIEEALSESPESDLPVGAFMPVTADTWRRVLRDDGRWLKDTLLRLGRGIQARRRLAASLPGEVVADVLALWLSPDQVLAVLATVGVDTMSFTREAANTEAPREASSAASLLAALTCILVDGGAWEFSESGYRASLANQTVRGGDDSLCREKILIRPESRFREQVHGGKAAFHGKPRGMLDEDTLPAVPDAAKHFGVTRPRGDQGSPAAESLPTDERLNQSVDIAGAWNGHSVLSPTPVRLGEDAGSDLTSERGIDPGTHPSGQTRRGAHTQEALSPTAAKPPVMAANVARPTDPTPAPTHLVPVPAGLTQAPTDPPPAISTRCPDSTDGAIPAGATLAALGAGPTPGNVDLLRHLRGAPTPSYPSDALRRALRALLEQRSAAAREDLRSAMEYPGAGRRLAGLLSGGDLADVLQWLRPTDGARALAVAAQVSELGQYTVQQTPPRQDAAKGVLSAAGGVTDHGTNTRNDGDSDTIADSVAHIVSEFLLTDLFEEGRALDPESLGQRLAGALGDALVPRAKPAPLARPGTANPMGTTNPQGTTIAAVTTNLEGAHQSHFERTSARADPRPCRLQPASAAEDAALTQRIYIANAGIVIVGPYLPRLFSMLALTDKESFISLSHAHRAVHLIQYIVTGATSSPEPILVLNKILCGLPISTPIPLDIDLRSQEQAAIEDMLAAIIAHWKAIGHTSVAGLRESFLQREGRLRATEEAWQLRVESKCFDMLLDRLPWGYTMVKYPWMKRVLHVDWR